jgi:hypothetical protein
MDEVKWPGPVGDLLQPIKWLAQGLELQRKDEDPPDRFADKNVFVQREDTPYSLQLITAGSLRISQQAVKVVTWLGGAGGIAAAVGGFWLNLDLAERLAYVGFGAGMLAVAFLSIAIIVRSDVQARGQAQAAEYEARGRIAATFLSAACPYPEGAEPPTQRRYWVRSDEMAPGTWTEVVRFIDQGRGRLAACTVDGRTIRKENIAELKSNLSD